MALWFYSYNVPRQPNILVSPSTELRRCPQHLSVFESFNPSKSKPIIDEIDKVLAKHYGFTDEELDFIINYDIKYRMGDELNGDGE